MPLACSPPSTRDPLPKLRTRRVEVQIQAVATQERQASRGEAPLEVVDAGDWINGEAQLQAMGSAAQSSADPIQTARGQIEGAKGAVVWRRTMRGCPREPGRDAGLAMTEHARDREYIESFR